MLTTLVHIILILIHTKTYIYYVFKNYCIFFNFHISGIYQVLYPIILKINVSTYWIRVIFDTRIIYVHHRRKINIYNI